MQMNPTSVFFIKENILNILDKYANQDTMSLRMAFAENSSNFQGNQAANATVGLKTGAGSIASVSVNTKAGAAQTLTVVDGVSGASTPILGKIDATTPGQYLQGAKFNTGLTYFFSVSNAATDVTISYH